MYLKQRDIFMLKAFDKLRVMDIQTTQKLCNWTSYFKCANRLQILCDEKYIKCYQENMIAKKYYHLTQKGMNTIYKDIKKKPPTVSKTTINHEILVANVLYYLLQCNQNLTMNDFMTDRELMCMKSYNQKKREHLCDLFCKKYRVKIEVELSLKKISELSKNFYMNGYDYTQVWIVGNTTIYNRLKKLKENNQKFNCYIIRLNELDKHDINLKSMYDELFSKNEYLRKNLEHLKKLEEKKIKQLSIEEI